MREDGGGGPAGVFLRHRLLKKRDQDPCKISSRTKPSERSVQIKIYILITVNVASLMNVIFMFILCFTLMWWNHNQFH